MDKSYFPILLRYSDTGEKKILDSPEEIENSRGFTVIETEVDFFGIVFCETLVVQE